MKIYNTIISSLLFLALIGFLLPLSLYAVSIDQVEEQALQLLERIHWYEFGMNREPLTTLQDLITDNTDPQTRKRLEMLFIDFLDSDATLASKQMICKKLSQIATVESIDVLTHMLKSDETADMARYVVERIPNADSAVETALLNALPNRSEQTRIGIINSLTGCGGEKTCAYFEKSIQSRNPFIAKATVAALGKLASERSEAILWMNVDKNRAIPQDMIWDAILLCADRRLEKGKNQEAEKTYTRVFQTADSDIVRIAALRGMVLSDSRHAGALVVRVLETENRALESTAIRLLEHSDPLVPASTLMPLFHKLETRQQSQLLAMLAEIGNKDYLPLLKEGLRSQFHIVRLAALRALRFIGDVSMIRPVAVIAAIGPGIETLEAQITLARMHGENIDSEIIDLIKKNQIENDIKAVLIESVADRQTSRATDILLQTARDSSDYIRVTSIKSLAEIAGPQHLDEMTKILVQTKFSSETTHAINALTKVAMRIKEPARRSDAIFATVDSFKQPENKIAVLRVLGKIGDPDALPFIRNALSENNQDIRIAAIRALADWPNAKVAEILYDVSKNAAATREIILALRGYIDVVRADTTLSPGVRVNFLQQALQLATRAVEQRRALAALADIPNLEALQTALEYLSVSAVREEAAMAVVQIAEGLQKTHPQVVQSACQQVVAKVDHQDIKAAAIELMTE